MSRAADELKAPYPWPGGKSRVADRVWARIGNVDNAIEPFMGSLAWLLRRPADHFAGGYRVETANDLNHYVVNFWRAVKADPDAVAAFADAPVLEADLHARHKWLVRSEHAAGWRQRMAEDPEHYDAKVAGWWVWGACAWIGGQWCQDGVSHKRQLPTLDQTHGVNNRAEAPTDWRQAPNLTGGVGVHGVDHRAKRPALERHDGAPGTGVLGNRPNLADQFDIGRGVNAAGDLGTCDARRVWLTGWMRQLADRLRLVRTCYGHWSRICDSESTLTRLGTTGVFLDPPYPTHRADNGKKSRDGSLYATDKGADLDALRDEVLAWCRRWGKNPKVRVALCCYEGDGYEPLEAEGWTVEAWEANGGYANQRRKGRGKAENAKRERIYYSPHCVPPQRGLFDDVEAA